LFSTGWFQEQIQE